MMKITATLLILSCVLHVKAIPGAFHENLLIVCCSDSDGEMMYGMDGEVKGYADFTKKKWLYLRPDFMDHTSDEKDAYNDAVAQLYRCQTNLKTISSRENLTLESEAPDTMIYTREEVQQGVSNVLICHVTGFYPAPVTITWTRNNLNLTSDVTTTVPYLKDDGTFYQFSSVKFTPEQGDSYSCTVNHQSLPAPKARVWDVDHDLPSPPSMGPDVFCGVGLTLGILGVAMGTFFLVKGNQVSLAAECRAGRGRPRPSHDLPAAERGRDMTFLLEERRIVF